MCVGGAGRYEHELAARVLASSVWRPTKHLQRALCRVQPLLQLLHRGAALPAAHRRAFVAPVAGAAAAAGIPWRLLLSKPAVWALIISHFCHNWGTFILLTWMPTYYNQARPPARPPLRLHARPPAHPRGSLSRSPLLHPHPPTPPGAGPGPPLLWLLLCAAVDHDGSVGQRGGVDCRHHGGARRQGHPRAQDHADGGWV